MRFLAKTKQDSDVTERTSVVYAKNGIKLSWLIRSSVLYEENQIGQWHDQSIGLLYAKIETELLGHV